MHHRRRWEFSDNIFCKSRFHTLTFIYWNYIQSYISYNEFLYISIFIFAHFHTMKICTSIIWYIDFFVLTHYGTYTYWNIFYSYIIFSYSTQISTYIFIDNTIYIHLILAKRLICKDFSSKRFNFGSKGLRITQPYSKYVSKFVCTDGQSYMKTK